MKEQPYEAVEAEIRKEKAEALGRAGERLEQILQELESVRRELLRLAAMSHSDPDGCPRVPAEVEEKIAMHARLREQARRYRHYLVIQREALGLWGHDDVDQCYPVPAPLTLPRLAWGEETR